MKRAGYQDAIDWIALNDSPGDDDNLDPETAGSLVTSVMVAHLWDKDHIVVGTDVVKARKKFIKDGTL